MLGRDLLKISKVSFITKDGEELEENQLPNEEYQAFCNEFEEARLQHKIKWPEFDERYAKEK
ncbi:hypothetical protein [Tepidibacter sp. Z1-5]|uniref:hypothetical protein n=1 Tax=Tepidibacter sp. Z1-5 TaxID=3134138 RepID=UPI0030C03C35